MGGWGRVKFVGGRRERDGIGEYRMGISGFWEGRGVGYEDRVEEFFFLNFVVYGFWGRGEEVVESGESRSGMGLIRIIVGIGEIIYFLI